MKPALSFDEIIKAEAARSIDASVREGMKENRRYLFDLALEALALSAKYPLESKSSVFDFKGREYFSLWTLDDRNVSCLISDETYRSRKSKIGVAGLLLAAKHDWFRKTIEREVFRDTVSDFLPGIYGGDVTGFLKYPSGKLFGHDNDKEKVFIEYIPKGILL